MALKSRTLLLFCQGLCKSGTGGYVLFTFSKPRVTHAHVVSSINQNKPVQKSRQQVLTAYCPKIYTVVIAPSVSSIHLFQPLLDKEQNRYLYVHFLSDVSTSSDITKLALTPR